MVDKLTLILGANITIPNTSVKIHQPTLSEIALIGEERFFYSLNSFTIDAEKIKDFLIKQNPNVNAEVFNKVDEYSILLSFLNSDEKLQESFLQLCDLLFINYKIQIYPNYLMMISKNQNEDKDFFCDLEFFLNLKQIVQKIFKLDKLISQSSLNPKGELAEKIASKMRKARKKVEEQKKEKTQGILSRFISILSIGSNSINILDIKEFTIYQLYDQFDRYKLYDQYQNSIKAALVGGKDEIADWTIEI